MEIEKIGYDFSVCKLVDYSLVDLNAEYSFIGKTDEEKSLVCLTGVHLAWIAGAICTRI